MGCGGRRACAGAVASVLVAIELFSGCSSSEGEDAGSPAFPPPPSGLKAIPGNNQVSLSWNPVAGATSYTLYWDVLPGVNKHSGTPIAGVASPHVHQGLSNGTSYYYVVTAMNMIGEGNPSGQASATAGVPQSPYDPPWSTALPSQVIGLDHDPQKSSTQNGAALVAAIAALQPGQRLELGSGVWSVNSFFSIDRVGTAAAPIWIAAKAGATPILTRPDAAQNAVNLGANSGARYLVLEGLELTGGDTALKIYDAMNVWIDRCEIHHCGGAGIAANTVDTSFLYITRNEIHHTAGTAEGMYLGANNAAAVTHDSVVALNHVHDTAGSQGDGIELKQGSWGNWIAENHVHDTQYPCILAYGTGGDPPNLIERNVCYRSGDNVMQVQGEALVRNNLLVDGAQGFQSHDHQGMSVELVFVHNTIVNTGRGANLQSWNGRPGMVFANNAVYSQSAESVRFANGSAGVDLAGNVVLGPVVGAASGFTPGVGLSDFAGVAWNASSLDATPTASGALIGMADAVWLVATDLTGAALVPPYEPGCLDGP